MDSSTTFRDGSCSLAGAACSANDTDVDGDSLDWEIVSQPSHGEAMYVEPLFFAYKPDPDWSTLPGNQPGGDWVSDSFTYRAFDGIAYSDPATMRFWLVPINDPPTFTPGPAYIWSDEDVQYEAPWATAISTGPANESYQSITFEIVGLHDEDLFSVAPVIDADGVLSFTPAPDATGYAELTVRAKDDGGLERLRVRRSRFRPAGRHERGILVRDRHPGRQRPAGRVDRALPKSTKTAPPRFH